MEFKQGEETNEGKRGLWDQGNRADGLSVQLRYQKE